MTRMKLLLFRLMDHFLERYGDYLVIPRGPTMTADIHWADGTVWKIRSHMPLGRRIHMTASDISVINRDRQRWATWKH